MTRAAWTNSAAVRPWRLRITCRVESRIKLSRLVSFASLFSSTIVRTNVESSTEEVGMRESLHAALASTAATTRTGKWRQVMCSNAIG